MTISILYVLPVRGGGGGAHSVAQEANELIRFGVRVRIAVNSSNAASFATNYADLPDVARAVVPFDDEAGLSTLMEGVDLVVATVCASVATIARALELVDGPRPRIGYYIQDYEPLFFPPGDEAHADAVASYERIPGALLFAKTDWIREIVQRNHAVSVAKVAPSLDTSIYFPAVEPEREFVRVVAMVRPSTPRRAPRRTMSVLKEIKEKYGDAVDVNVFGCSDADIVHHRLPSDFAHTNHGPLSRRQVASLFRTTDVVLDLSDYQAFGRTGLEAMACGCATLLTRFGGAGEYAVDGKNTLLVDTRSRARIIARFDEYMDLAPERRRALRAAAVRTSQRYSIANAAWSELEVFERHLAAA